MFLPQQPQCCEHKCIYTNSFICGATAKPGPEQPHFEVSRSHTNRNKQTNIHTHTHKQTHTHPVRVGVDAATYTTHNKHNDETSISSVEFEPAIPAIKRPQTYSLEDTATAICPCKYSDHFSNNLTILLRERGAFPTTFISKNFITHMHKKLSFYICMLYFDTFFRK